MRARSFLKRRAAQREATERRCSLLIKRESTQKFILVPFSPKKQEKHPKNVFDEGEGDTSTALGRSFPLTLHLFPNQEETTARAHLALTHGPATTTNTMFATTMSASAVSASAAVRPKALSARRG